MSQVWQGICSDKLAKFKGSMLISSTGGRLTSHTGTSRATWAVDEDKVLARDFNSYSINRSMASLVGCSIPF